MDDRSEFPSAVIELMRVPRLCALAVAQRERLQDIGDITAERLIYEDWMDRLERRGPITGLNSDAEMKDFAAGLGAGLRKHVDRPFSRRDVLDTLSIKSGRSSTELSKALGEVTSGLWLTPSTSANTYKISASHVPFVLGLTLVSELQGVSSSGAVPGRIADFMDPLKAGSLGCDILCAATTVALIDLGVGREIREALLKAWLEQQNFHQSDFEAFWRLAGLDGELFLDIAEVAWLSASTKHFIDEVLIKAFANASEFQDFGVALRQRLTQWLGVAWQDVEDGAVIDPVDKESSMPTQRTRQRFDDLMVDLASADFTSVTQEDEGEWSWLGCRAIAILSYVPRAAHVRAFEAWALSRAVMGSPQHLEEVAWALRLNRRDPEEGDLAVKGVVGRLADQSGQVFAKAAQYLQAAMGAVDRSFSTFSRTEDSADAPELVDVGGLAGESLFDEARNAFSFGEWKQFSPEDCVALANRVVLELADSREDAMNLVLSELRGMLILLSEEALRHLGKLVEDLAGTIDDEDETKKVRQLQLLTADLVIRLYRSPPEEQSRLVLSCGLGRRREHWLPLLRQLQAIGVEGCEIPTDTSEHLADWLLYLAERLSGEGVRKLDFLVDLVTHSDPRIRFGALVLAVQGQHMDALGAYAGSSCSAKSPQEAEEHSLSEEYWHNRAILESCEHRPHDGLVNRLSPQHVALIVKNRPDDREAIRRLNQYVRDEFEMRAATGTVSWPRHWCSHKEAIACLVREDLPSVLAWLEPWLDSPPSGIELWVRQDLLFIGLMRALGTKAPEVAFRLYDVLIEGGRGSIFSVEGILSFPFEVRDVECSHDRREKLIMEAENDKSLLQHAVVSFRHCQVDWLMERIERLEEGQRPVDVARAYTLLGFCDECPEADEMWEVFLTRPPEDPWLSEVLNKSLESYASNRRARAALEEYWESQRPGDAWRLLREVIDICDARVFDWHIELSPDWSTGPYEKETAFGFSIAALKERVKKDGDRKKKFLFHSDIGFSLKAPWT